MGSSASSVLKSSRGGGRHGLLLFRSGCIKPYGIGDDESHELFIGRIQPDVFQLLSERINREAREKASQGGVQEGAGQGLDAAKVEKHVEPLGQCGGRLLAQKSSVFGVDADRADLVDDLDCLHGLASPFSATSPLNASVHAISLLFSCEGSDSPSGHSLGPVLQHETGDAGEVADVARDQNSLVL